MEKEWTDTCPKLREYNQINLGKHIQAAKSCRNYFDINVQKSVQSWLNTKALSEIVTNQFDVLFYSLVTRFDHLKESFGIFRIQYR